VIKKRFIAAASCPSCKSPDTLRWWVENNIEHVECVECDYTELRTPKSLQESDHSDQTVIGLFKPE
jgi:uncharacterized protein